MLDGQQRITSGIHLFYNDSDQINTQYFLNLQKLYDEFKDGGYDLDDEISVEKFLLNLDVDSGYLKATNKNKDPYSLLNKNHLLYTPLLRDDNAKKREGYLESYIEKFPDNKNFINSVLKPYFLFSSGPSIPIINIESEFKLDAISRIFATLNSTGKVLTPFELVVAVLYPKNIDLRADIEEGRDIYEFYPVMDPTGEIVLQTAVMFGGGDQKKSLIPKNLTPDVWNTHKAESFKWLDESGRFLTENLGMSLNKTDELVPYDSIFVPLAFILRKINFPAISAKERAEVIRRISKWVVGTALEQRYQEGVHNKQKSDASQISDWAVGKGTEPEWLERATVPGLTLVTPTGAIGRMFRSLMNRKKICDPVSRRESNFGHGVGELHHIFPTKFVSKLEGWSPDRDKVNLLLNTMMLDAETNKVFLNDDPRLQVREAKKSNLNNYLSDYGVQLIDDALLAIMEKAEKTRDDYRNFLKIRETAFERLLEEFEIQPGSNGEGVDDSEDA